MSGVDLNLIRVFVKLYEARSVTLASQQLFVTQPSVSYSLAKLRDIFKDQLFVRSRDGMEPTSLALQLYPVLQQSLGQIDDVVDGGKSFDPVSSARRFVIAMTDLGELSLLPSIFGYLQREAPNLVLEVKPLEIDKAEDWLLTGAVDAVICSTRLSPSGMERRVILEERYVCVINKRFAPTNGPLTLDHFKAQRHALISRALGHNMADEVLNDIGLKRRVGLVLAHFSILPSILSATDLMVILPCKIAQSFAAMAPLQIYDLPFPVPPVQVALYSKATDFRPPALRWFLAAVAAAVGAEAGSGRR